MQKIKISGKLFILIACLLLVVLTLRHINNDVVTFANQRNSTSGWSIYLPPSFGLYLKKFDMTNLAEMEKQFMKFYMPVMLNRVQIVGDICRANPELVFPMSENIDFTFIIRNNFPTIVWCCNFKVGSGTWTTNFLRVTDFNKNNTEILALPPTRREEERLKEKFGATLFAVKELFPTPKDLENKSTIFKGAIRFLSVRHPFIRVLSGFRNIIERSIPTLKEEELFRQIRKRIIVTYRPSNSTDKSKFPTFPEFIDYFINETKSFTTAAKWMQWNRILGGYWDPFWVHCNVCSSDYNVIVKLETMSADERFLVILGNLTEVKNRKKQEWKHKLNGKTSDNLAAEYYMQLKYQQMFDLYNIYKYDFQLFNYEIEEFLTL